MGRTEEGEEKGEGEKGKGEGSPYRVRLYTPGKGGRGGEGVRRRDEAEVEAGFGGGV